MADPSLVYVTDGRRHLVCLPYSVDNLHRMAAALGLDRCWFHKDHYDVPKLRQAEIEARCVRVRPRDVLRIVGRQPQRKEA